MRYTVHNLNSQQVSHAYKPKSKAIVTGSVTKKPQRLKTATGKVMATMTIQAESDKRSRTH